MSRFVLIFGCAVSFFLCSTSRGQVVNSPSPLSGRVVVSPEEREALIAIFTATAGTNWNKHDGWLGPPGTECTWYGIECRPLDGGPVPVTLYITGLELSANNLVGRIPDAVTSLAHLENLDIVGNHLSGKLPNSLIERWLANLMWLVADAPQLTDISVIDFESAPTAIICGRHRIILHADGSALDYAVLCRNATPDDRTTYCLAKEGHLSGAEFARLALSLEKNGYFALQPHYDKSITHGEFESTRVTRAEKDYPVVDYAEGGPLALWTMHRAIEGVASEADWEKIERQPQCPRWDKPEVPQTP